MFKKRLQQGEEVLHRCIEGEKVGVDCSKIVDVDRRHDPCPGGTPAPPGERGREPPSFFFFLGLLPRWEEGFPSGPWPSWRRRGRSPSRLDLPLCSLLFFLPVFWLKTVSYIPGDP